ncbi:hypothetical protein BDV96DRAFT_633650 [Lophiotrema nucula]|uniref:Uncharacterized protein n=1 Tax=Lophiotrema nucula TaxID=690887 RepID=A0A6A5Z0L7_9PLEO|nr:hypothetical protein BDV96DRAFT_633650 [Lophiotrema nucula]
MTSGQPQYTYIRLPAPAREPPAPPPSREPPVPPLSLDVPTTASLEPPELSSPAPSTCHTPAEFYRRTTKEAGTQTDLIFTRDNEPPVESPHIHTIRDVRFHILLKSGPPPRFHISKYKLISHTVLDTRFFNYWCGILEKEGTEMGPYGLQKREVEVRVLTVHKWGLGVLYLFTVVSRWWLLMLAGTVLRLMSLV